MDPYPKNVNADSVVDAVNQMSRLREQDITDANNVKNTYVQGRKVGKIPASSTDTASTDNIGDFNVTSSYAYYCVSNGSGGAIWVRVGVSSW